MFVGIAIRIDMMAELAATGGGFIPPDARYEEDAAGNATVVRVEEDGVTVRTQE